MRVPPTAWKSRCSSGGRRIALETVSRFHTSQKSDYWFHNNVDQASIWSLSQYLPNVCFMAPVNRLDDYSFHSAMASSLNLGWIADAKDFDLERAKALADRYRRVRPLLVGAWYPLLGYSRDESAWMASQYHRPDLGRGMVLVFRRAKSPYVRLQVALRGLDAKATYELEYVTAKRKASVKGARLTADWPIELPRPGGTELILYRRAGKAKR